MRASLAEDFAEAIAASPGTQISDSVRALLDRVIDHCRAAGLPIGTAVFRVRRNVARPFDKGEFDSSPNGAPSRFSDGSTPVLYGALDVETCIHEGRVLAEDEITIATLVVTRDLRVLDLTDVAYDAAADGIGEGGDIFYFVSAHLLFGSRSREAQLLGMRVRERGFDGIKYPSFFSDVRPKRERFPNIAIFGEPIREGVVEIQSLNNVRLDTVRYEFTLGPVTQTPSEEDLHELRELVSGDWEGRDINELQRRIKEILARSEPPN